MDSDGRLHMPNGFVGQTFKETGALDEKGSNRKERRRRAAVQAAIDRLTKRIAEEAAK